MFFPTIITLHSEMEERSRNGGPDEGMWTSHYLEGMGYKCIPGSTSRSLGSEYSDANRSAKKTIIIIIIFIMELYELQL